MVNLPNAKQALVEREKIVDYLLNPAHRYGASKARFFARFGFRVTQWKQLAETLREHGRTHEVARVRETGFGPRYMVDGELKPRAAGVRACEVYGKWTKARLRRD